MGASTLARRPCFGSPSLQHANIFIRLEQALTLVCTMQPTAAEAMHLDVTLRAFADACAYIHTTIPARITNVMRMQAKAHAVGKTSWLGHYRSW
jgi:hypothetical protein